MHGTAVQDPDLRREQTRVILRSSLDSRTSTCEIIEGQVETMRACMYATRMEPDFSGILGVSRGSSRHVR